MPTREMVLRSLDDSGDFEQVGRTLGVPPGQAFMIATGLPADGSDTFPPDEPDRPGMPASSTQRLVYTESEPENPPSAKLRVHRWVKCLAEADQQMRRAASARDAAPEKVSSDGETDVCTVLTRDHDQVTALLKQLKTIPGVTSGGSAVHLSRRKSIADIVVVALSQHEATEQELFWPAVRSLLPNGEEITERGLEQEQEGKELLHALGETAATDPDFDELVVTMDEAARRHVAHEDTVLLALRQLMSVDARRQLGAKFRRAEEHAPTRPHPHAPKAPQGATTQEQASDEVGASASQPERQGKRQAGRRREPPKE